ncbi:endolytic transglycosylase MltG [Streptomyces boncukensis]|uniref:Endolytic murein transglycosylase n=1 Tax=Streptomyces boncukensis TaxID=2711219 RepID=A0A6G4X3I0_9ACTN|nr:endolytic transglycosylase MltG [Streptomyces boncukensis]NGO71407.1 endolytic transglycosylase MltG [Streptomyces boncukensis]
MTEYGQGPGSQPWHPDDPLYGDRDAYGGQPAGYQDGWSAPPQPGEYPHPQQQSYYPQEYYEGTAAYGYGGQQYDPSCGAVGADPYGIPHADPYGMGERPDYYAQQGGYPPPRPQYLREQPEPVPHPHAAPQGAPAAYAAPQDAPYAHPYPYDAPAGPDQGTGWDPGPDQGEHAFFTEGGEDPDRQAFLDDPDDEEPRRRGGRDGTKRKRNGCACLAVTVVLAAGVGTVGYFGYQFYQSHFAPPPDFEGSGKGDVQIDIPDGASLSDMGDVLKREGVVKSSRAFVEAADGNKKAQSIQAGSYVLRKRMSGSSAVGMMLDPSSQNGLIVAEGWRAKKIYAEIDKKLDEPEGTTRKAAKSAKLGLPSWAGGKPEGFLFPSRYSIGKDSKPADVLRTMVKRAEAEYTKTGLEAAAKKTGKTPEQIITIASLIQAEAQQDHEFGKVSRVIYNRLDQGMLLGFDSTINYAKGRSTLNTTVEDTRYSSPYNTYLHKGLPPGPIGNPGHQAIEAALKPTEGNWLYFVTVKPGDTRFTDSKAEHDKNVQDFNAVQRKQKENGG